MSANYVLLAPALTPTGERRSTTSNEPRARKRRHLNYDKCTYCRRDKKAVSHGSYFTTSAHILKCSPSLRSWPGEKCVRCEENNFPCSASQRTPGKANANADRIPLPVPGSDVDSAIEVKNASDETTLAQTLPSSNQEFEDLLLKIFYLNDLEKCLTEFRATKPKPPVNKYLDPPINTVEKPDIKGLVAFLDDLRSSIQLALNSRGCLSTHELNLALLLSSLQYNSQNVRLLLETISTDQRVENPVMAFLLQRESLIAKTVGYSSQLREEYRQDFNEYINMHSRLLASLERLNFTKFPLRPVLHDPDVLVSLCKNSDYSYLEAVLIIHAGQTNVTGSNLLHIFAGQNLFSHIDYLVQIFVIDHQSLAASQDYFGRTPLHIACAHGQYSRARALLSKREHINVEDYGGATALHTSIAHRHIEIVEMLLKVGANPNQKSSKQWWSTPLGLATNTRNYSIANLLLKHGAEVDSTNKNGSTALWYAAYVGVFDILRLLLVHGANVNAKTWFGWTPLHAATRHGSVTVIQALLDHGADINAQDCDQWSALHIAALRERANCAKLLLKHGIYSFLRTAEGETALDLAHRFRRMDIVEILQHWNTDYEIDLQNLESDESDEN